MVREMNIVPVYNGYIVQCGCQRFVFDNPVEMTQHILGYYDDPTTYEKYFLEMYKVNDMMGNVGEVPPPAMGNGSHVDDAMD